VLGIESANRACHGSRLLFTAARFEPGAFVPMITTVP
jgi:hypothetical protein